MTTELGEYPYPSAMWGSAFYVLSMLVDPASESSVDDVLTRIWRHPALVGFWKCEGPQANVTDNYGILYISEDHQLPCMTYSSETSVVAANLATPYDAIEDVFGVKMYFAISKPPAAVRERMIEIARWSHRVFGVQLAFIGEEWDISGLIEEGLISAHDTGILFLEYGAVHRLDF
jgi:hypothetical protein